MFKFPQIVIPPVRSLYPFIFQGTRWSIPKFNKLDRRLKTNLLYFQTNYMIFGVVCFLIFVLLSMKILLTGVLSAIIIAISVLFFTDNIPQAREIKQKHPTLVIAAGIVLIIVFWHSISTLIIILAGALSSVPVWLLHASLRCSDNLVGGSESVINHFASSPLGLVMRLFGIEATAYLKE